MRLEAVRATADWLVDPTHGVNPYIASVPRDPADPPPAQIPAYVDPTYSVNELIGVFDETRHPWVLDRKLSPPTWPALYVTGQGPVRVEGIPEASQTQRLTRSPIQVVVRYIASNQDLAVAVRDGLYTARAIVRSLFEMQRAQPTPRNGIALNLLEDPIEIWPVFAEVGQGKMTCAVVTNWAARDTLPGY